MWPKIPLVASVVGKRKRKALRHRILYAQRGSNHLVHGILGAGI